MPMRLTQYRVETFDDAQELRWVRNMCRGTFANDNHEISKEEQDEWWERARKNTFAWTFTYFDSETGLDYIAGFGLLKYAGDAWWTSVGVVPSARGHGFGYDITRYLISQPLRPIYGSAIPTNPGGIKLHEADYWDKVSESPDIILFKVKDDISI